MNVKRFIYIQEWLYLVKNFKKTSQIYQKQNQKNHQKRGGGLKKNNLKKNLFFNTKSKEENSTAPQKANVKAEICRENKECDL